MKTSQRERILSWLRERGNRGVHSFELVEAHMPRGADAILRLRRAGYEIESRRESFRGEAKGVRYVLVREPDGSAPSAPAPVIEASGLFGSSPKTTTRNPYEYEAA